MEVKENMVTYRQVRFLWHGRIKKHDVIANVMRNVITVTVLPY